MRRFKFGVDLDGTTVGTIEALAAKHGLPAPTKWDCHEEWGWSLDKFKAVMHDPATFADCPPYPDALPWVKYLHEQGAEIEFYTARCAEVRPATQAWLDREVPFDGWSVRYADIDVLKTGGGYDAFVDDRPENLVSMMESKSCTVGLLFTQPWNRWFSPHPSTGIVRVDDWMDCGSYVNMLMELMEVRS